jgi:hypothetical protein
MYSLLLGALCGPPVLPGFARRSGNFPMEESRIRNRMAGVQPEATSARMPCVHAGFENPFVAYNATSGAVKSMEKGRFPQDLCGFFRFLPIFSYFLWFLAEFQRVFRDKALKPKSQKQKLGAPQIPFSAARRAPSSWVKKRLRLGC